MNLPLESPRPASRSDRPAPKPRLKAPEPLPPSARKPRRNDKLVDWWSLTHFTWGFVLVLFFHPLIAFGLLVLWEPVEIFVLSPLLARFGILFGHEHLKNSLSDILFDGFGVVVGLLVLGMVGVDVPVWPFF